MKHMREATVVLLKSFAAAFVLLLVTLAVTPTAVYADVEFLVKDKTNKLVVGDSVDECLKGIEEEQAAGKSITYKISVPKGTLYIKMANASDFKIEIYNSKNKVMKKIESIRNVLYGEIALASGGVNLSKGKYKIKISPKDKSSELKLGGIVAMLKNNTSGSISLDKQYNIAVQEGKTYKLKFTIKIAKANEENRMDFSSQIQSYDPNDILPFTQEFKIVNSEGKSVARYDGFLGKGIRVKNGTYTIVFEANKTGIYSIQGEGWVPSEE
jgi:flagellar hook assembly protein FlgD